MFGRDYNPIFQMGNNQGNNNAQKESNRHPRNKPIFNGPLPPFPPPPLGKSLPVNRKSFREIRNFIILTIISENNGITGYQLQERYNFPRGTLLRTLQSFEEKQYVETTEEVIQGRTNKFYTINEKGQAYLDKLKKKWANLFAMMSEKANPERCKHPFAREWFRLMMLEHVGILSSKADAEEFFNKIQGGINEMINRFTSRIEKLKHFREEIAHILNDIEKMEKYDQSKVETNLELLFHELREEMQENN